VFAFIHNNTDPLVKQGAKVGLMMLFSNDSLSKSYSNIIIAAIIKK